MTKFLLLLLCATLVVADQVFGFHLGGSPGVATASAGLGLLAFTPFRSPEPEGTGGGGRGTIGEKLAAAESAVAGLNTRIATLEQELAAAQSAADAAANTEVARLTAALAEKETALATAQAELKAAADGKTAAEAEVTKLTAEKKTVEERAQEMVAALGFPAGKLPAADDESAENIDDLRARVAEAKDPAEKQKLVNRIRALRDA